MSDQKTQIEAALAFMKLPIDTIPSMKTLNKQYRIMSLLMHPDKNPGREAEFTVVFQTLLNHFKLLGEVIKENIKDKNVSDEESYEVHLFNSFNFQKQNTNCYVVYIENALSMKWNDVLTHKYGVHKDGTEKNNGDNLAKDVQSHFIRGPWLKQHNFHSKTYASNSKHHIYDRNMCPKHRDVNWMVYNRVIRFEMSPPEPFEICYFG